jgi:hypothetical protein
MFPLNLDTLTICPDEYNDLFSFGEVRFCQNNLDNILTAFYDPSGYWNQTLLGTVTESGEQTYTTGVLVQSVPGSQAALKSEK